MVVIISKAEQKVILMMSECLLRLWLCLPVQQITIEKVEFLGLFVLLQETGVMIHQCVLDRVRCISGCSHAANFGPNVTVETG